MNNFRLLLPLALLTASVLSACASAPGVDPMTKVSPCTGHCETHSEGYDWAQRSNLSDAQVCNSYPPEFASGCRDGVNDLQQMRPYAQGI